MTNQSCYVEISLPKFYIAMNKQKDIEKNEPATDFHGAALIDEDGNEIPITEDMVQDACHEAAENTGNDDSEENSNN